MLRTLGYLDSQGILVKLLTTLRNGVEMDVMRCTLDCTSALTSGSKEDKSLAADLRHVKCFALSSSAAKRIHVGSLQKQN